LSTACSHSYEDTGPLIIKKRMTWVKKVTVRGTSGNGEGEEEDKGYIWSKCFICICENKVVNPIKLFREGIRTNRIFEGALYVCLEISQWNFFV
jgi:hypothetical protein